MKIRAIANGNVIDIDDAGAKVLIDAGIYEPVDEPKSKKVTPLTTKDVAPLVKRKGR